MDYYRYQQGWGTKLRNIKNKRSSTCKNRGGETNLRKRENKWISTGKKRGGGPN